jgi:hypothetical protein
MEWFVVILVVIFDERLCDYLIWLYEGSCGNGDWGCGGGGDGLAHVPAHTPTLFTANLSNNNY